MYPRIFFRSIRAGRQTPGQSFSMIKNRGLGWSHIREYREGDESRDIVWRRSQGTKLFSLEREDMGNFDVIVLRDDPEMGDEFRTQSHPVSYRAQSDLTIKMLRASTRAGGHPLREYQGADGIQQLLLTHPRNALILMLGHHVDPEYHRLAKFNDVIFIDIIHPFEEKSRPTDSLFMKDITDSIISRELPGMKKISRKNHCIPCDAPIYRSQPIPPQTSD